MSGIVHLFTNWPSAWASLALVLGLLGFGFLEIRQTRNPQKTAQKNDNPADKHPSRMVSNHTTADQKHPTEEEHRSAQQAYWDRRIKAQNRVDWVAWVTLGFSALATAGVILSFRETQRQADIAQSALIQTNRAWINVTVEPANISLKWTNTEHPTMEAMITGTNEGNSPAIDVQVFPVLVMPQSGQAIAIRNRVRGYCSGYEFLGNIVFIKDKIDQSWVVTLNDKSIDGWISRVKRAVAPGAPIVVPLSLIICTAYKIVGDNATHHIARIYDIVTMTSGHPVTPFLGIDLPFGQVVLERHIDAEYAD